MAGGAFGFRTVGRIFTYNWLGIERYEVAAGDPISPGEQVLRFDFAYDGGKPGAGGVGGFLWLAPSLPKAGSPEPSRLHSPPTKVQTSVKISQPR